MYVCLRRGGTRVKIEFWNLQGKPTAVTCHKRNRIGVIPDKDTLITDVPELFARKTIELLQNKKLQRKISNNVHEIVEKKCSWEICAEPFDQICNETILVSKKCR